MNWVVLVTGVVFGFMLAELKVSNRHERNLRRIGAVQPPGDVYWAIATLYPAAFALMAVEGVWRARHVGGVVASPDGPAWAAAGVLLFAASKFLKYWAVRSLGDRWTFRVFILPGRSLVTAGPYRYVAHPNYIAVIGELVATAMMVAAKVLGPVSIAVFGVALWARVRFEARVLREHTS